jgi:hypothetical protein
MDDNFKSIYDSEGYLKSLAVKYVSETGEEFLRGCETDAEGFDDKMLDTKMRAALELEKSRVSRGINRRAAMRGLIVASLILVVYMASRLLDFSEFTQETTDMAEIAQNNESFGGGFSSAEDTAAAPMAPGGGGSIEFLAYSLPEGWQLIDIDYDGSVTIFRLESSTGGSVVVLAGEPIYDYETPEFVKVYINEHPAFMRVESRHSILFFDMHGYQLVISANSSDFNELIELAEAWL